jgi:hypothetical protein
MADATSTDRQGWVEDLDQLSREREGQEVTIEVLDRVYGDQREAEHLPFAYASYDPRDDVAIVAVGGRSSSYPVVLRHMARHPTEIELDREVGAVRIVEQDGNTTIVSFFPPGHA